MNQAGVLKTSSVLFVCTANQIRSPAAEGIFKAALVSHGQNPEYWRVGSAGTWAMDGNPAFKEMVDLLKPEGIDLSAHRSRAVDLAVLSDFNLVLTMEAGQKEALQIVYPSRRADIYLLSEMAGMYTAVDDPVNGPKNDFVAAVKEIKTLIEAGFPRIVELAHSRNSK